MMCLPKDVLIWRRQPLSLYLTRIWKVDLLPKNSLVGFLLSMYQRPGGPVMTLVRHMKFDVTNFDEEVCLALRALQVGHYLPVARALESGLFAETSKRSPAELDAVRQVFKQDIDSPGHLDIDRSTQWDSLELDKCVVHPNFFHLPALVCLKALSLKRCRDVPYGPLKYGDSVSHITSLSVLEVHHESRLSIHAASTMAKSLTALST